MTKPGPRPTPTKILKLRDSKQVYKRSDEISVHTDYPRCPSFLDKKAKKIWRKTTKLLYKLDLVCKLDEPILVLFCEAYSRYLQIGSEITGNFIKTSNGNIITHPAIPLRNRYFEQVLKCAKELGLSPSARVNLAPKVGNFGRPSGTSKFFKKKLTG